MPKLRTFRRVDDDEGGVGGDGGDCNGGGMDGVFVVDDAGFCWRFVQEDIFFLSLFVHGQKAFSVVVVAVVYWFVSMYSRGIMIWMILNMYRKIGLPQPKVTAFKFPLVVFANKWMFVARPWHTTNLYNTTR